MRHRFTPRGMRPMLLLTLLAAEKALAGGVHFDGSLGPAGALGGPNYLIPAEAGKQAGGNLFHSFSQFDLSSGEIATFLGPTNPNAAAVANIIARITSGSASSLDGTIRSEISGANLYLVNPSGFVFGPHVSLDISGSFTATSASTVKLADGAHFDTHPGAGDLTLSAAPVSAFGFLPSAGAITVGNANDLPLHTNLSVPTGKSLSLLGGNLSLADANLSAPSGQVSLVSTAAACTIGANLRVPDPHGKINLNHSTITTSGTTGGKLVIRGGSLVVNDTQLVSNTEGPGAGGGIDIHVSGKATLLANGIVLTETSGAGKAGNVIIHAGSLTLESNALVSSLALNSATPAARAGLVDVTTGDLSVSGESFISTGTNGLARGGTVDVFAQNISLAGDATQNLTGIFSNAGVPPDSGVANSNRLHTGRGGDVNIHATDQLSITNSAFIANNTYGLGIGGNVNVSAGEIFLSGNGTGTRTGIFAEGRDGQSGNVSIQTPGRLAIINGAAVAADTIGLGPGGNVTVSAGNLFVAALGNATKTGIFADTDSLGAGGPGGRVEVRANSMLIADGGLISTKTLGLGIGGDTLVDANDLVIDRGGSPFFTGIAADSPLSGGHGGNVNVFSAMLTIRNGGQISASTAAGGDGGSVFVQATNLFLLGSSDLFTGIAADSLSTGAGGR
ncbi:MAG TPA: filamentous hemagglutinin N-terminal domain-containing protein, partial [Chthoniobacteraceae bacterium]